MEKYQLLILMFIFILVYVLFLFKDLIKKSYLDNPKETTFKKLKIEDCFSFKSDLDLLRCNQEKFDELLVKIEPKVIAHQTGVKVKYTEYHAMSLADRKLVSFTENMDATVYFYYHIKGNKSK